MPLRYGMSMGEVMRDLKYGPHHKNRTRAQEIAIAEKYSGGKQGRRKKKRSTKRRTKGRG